MLAALFTGASKLPWFKILKIAAPVALAAGVIWYAYDKGNTHGKNQVTAEWNAEKAAHNKAIDKLKAQIASQEKTHAVESNRISDELDQVKEDSARELLRLDAVYASRLQQSEQRAIGYRNLAQGGTTQCLSLASHAAELDATLEEGRRVVGELRQGIVEKDRQLNLLGSQIINDRTLLSGSNDAAAN